MPSKRSDVITISANCCWLISTISVIPINHVKILNVVCLNTWTRNFVCMVGYWSATRDGLDLLHLIQIGCIHIGALVVSEFWGLVTPFRDLFCSWSIFGCLQKLVRNAWRTANRGQMAGVRWYNGSHIGGVKTPLTRFWIQTTCSLAWFWLDRLAVWHCAQIWYWPECLGSKCACAREREEHGLEKYRRW